MRTFAALAAIFAVGCSSGGAAQPFDDGSGSSAPITGEPRQSYPEGPYGTVRGAIIENYRFLGWQKPKDSGYDTGALEPLSLAQFYDPKGEKGIRYLLITSTAVWCSVCKQEYVDFGKGKVAEYEAKGVRFLGALFEDARSDPAQPSDLELWGKQYAVTFPFVLDPELKFGGFFDVEATPMEMVVDTRTMQILSIDEGWVTDGDKTLWTYLDKLLGS